MRKVKWLFFAISIGILFFTLLDFSPKILADEPPSAIFVGDDTLKGLSLVSGNSERFKFIYEGKKGITWLKSQENDFLPTGTNEPKNIVFAIGLNEVSNQNKAKTYIDYFNKLNSEKLNNKGIKLFIKSIDPVDESKYGAKINNKIVAWNEKIKSGISQEIGYIDTYSLLISNYTTQANGYYFNDATNQQLFDFILSKIGLPTDIQLKEQKLASTDLSESAVNSWGKDKLGKRVYYDENSSIVTNTFKDIDGATYYFDKDGHYITGIHEFEDFTVFFNEAGIMIKGKSAKVDKEHYMLFDDNGHQLKDKWHEVNGKKYYVDPKGYLLTGWWTLGTTDYYFKEDGSAASGIVAIGNDFYLFNDDGSARVGWYEEDGEKYYFGQGGKMVKGQQTISGKHYYFKNDGKMARGWVKTAKGKFYYDLESGQAFNGKREIDGKVYFFTKTGQLKLGWVEVDSDKYYYKADGSIYKGLVKIGKNYYFFNKYGKALSGWQGEGKNKRYFSKDDYSMATGWKKIDGKKYFFTSKGTTLTGIKYVDGSYHLFAKEGNSQFSIPGILVTLVIWIIVFAILGIVYKYQKERIDPIILKALDIVLDKFGKKE